MRSLILTACLSFGWAAAMVAGAPDASAQEITSVAPTSLVRGTSTQVILRGTDLDLLTGVSIDGTGVGLGELVVDSATQARVVVQVGDRAATGDRSLQFEGGTAPELANALSITAGAVQVLALTPTDGSRGQTLAATLRGRNLDDVTSISLGDGVTTSAFNATSPVDATFQLVVTAAAVSGPRTLSLTSSRGTSTVEAAFDVAGGPVTIGRVTPSTVVRGEQNTVTVSGENIDRVRSVDFGPRIVVESWTPTSPTQGRAVVLVQAEAAAGPRSVRVESDTESGSLNAAVTVTRGSIRGNRVLPDLIRQGQSLVITIEGENLDGATAVTAGAGLTVSGIEPGFPTALTFTVDAALDASVGTRDLVVTAPAGTLTLEDALNVGERIILPPRFLLTDEVNVGSTDISTRASAGGVLENLGEDDEVVTRGAGAGDTDLFRLVLVGDDGAETPWDAPFTIEGGAQQRFVVYFEPAFRASSGATWPLTVRAGESIGTLSVTGRGTTQRLFVDGAQALQTLEVGSGASVALPQLRTRLDSSLQSRSVTISGIEVELDSGSSASDVDVELVRTTTGDDFFWGFTEVQWSLTDATAGVVSGRLLLTTSASTAATFVVPFAITVGSGGGGDTGNPDTDAGADAGEPDTGGSDAGSDAATDTSPAPDTDVESDADAGVADAGPADGSSAAPDSGSDGGGDGGGCSAGRSGGVDWTWALALAGLVSVAGKRRRRDAGADVRS
jgi:hypothetical protein